MSAGKCMKNIKGSLECVLYAKCLFSTYVPKEYQTFNRKKRKQTNHHDQRIWKLMKISFISSSRAILCKTDIKSFH